MSRVRSSHPAPDFSSDSKAKQLTVSLHYYRTDAEPHSIAAASSYLKLWQLNGYEVEQGNAMAWSKESRHVRGYGTAWDKLRLIILRRDCGICQPCMRRGLIHAGSQVDHIISKAKAKNLGWTDAQIDEASNLQTICSEAHKAKTMLEEGKNIKQTIGSDGWPKQ